MALAEVLLSDATCRIGTSRNLIVYTWRDPPTVTQLREASRISRALGRRYPAGTGLFNVIIEGTPRFSEEVRVETARLTADPAVASLGSADVVLLTGFAGVAVRGFMNTANLLARVPRPRQVFGDMASGAAWLAPKLAVAGEVWTPAQVMAVAEEMIGAR